MKELVFIQHALDRMKERNITEEMVIATLNYPDNIENSEENRKIAQRFIEGKLLRIIYEEDDEAISVVSAYRTSKVGKYQRGKG
jgi:hypothetical protein